MSKFAFFVIAITAIKNLFRLLCCDQALPSNDFAGTVPWMLGLLTNLNHLTMQNNQLAGFVRSEKG